MDRLELKKSVMALIDGQREAIIAVGRDIYSTPEYGYKEFETSKKLGAYLKELGLEVEENIAITGMKAVAGGKAEGPCVAILGELDAISCANHDDAVETGAVHACGHNIQVAGMYGAALGLVRSGAIKELAGRVSFIGTPAEEYIELEYRDELRKAGKITYFGGKQELIAKGYFDDVDIAMMFHALDMGEKSMLIGPESNGFIGKKVRYVGRESHAGSAPEQGINALNAATLGINNIHAQRDTFKDSDRVRVHPIITKGGDIVNSVPADVRLESYVRARTIDGMLDANMKVDRSLKAGAMAIGAEVQITSIPGYLPILRNIDLDNLFRDNLHLLGLGPEDLIEGGDFTGSFDFGDISHLMPAIHPMAGGVTGNLHTRDFKTIDEERAYIIPAKAMALTVIDLLYGKAEEARRVLDNFEPKMTKEGYLEFLQSVDAREIYKP
ncbi:MAG: amidohydrolase [delta proteobacterium ML8_F1]|nr:MAG: amidohydrolase [delta proteobacterium ML8_F1]